MTVIHIESVDQLILVGVGNADAEVPGIPERAGVEVIDEHQFAAGNSGRYYQQPEAARGR